MRSVRRQLQVKILFLPRDDIAIHGTRYSIFVHQTSKHQFWCFFDFGGHGAARDAALHVPTVYQVWSSALSISRLDDLDLWPFDLETGAHYCPWCEQTSYQFWCFLDFFFLDLSASTCHTHHVPSRHLTWWSWRLSMIRVFVLDLCTKFEVRRPFRFEDMAHFWSQH